MQIDGMERRRAHIFDAHHHHPRHPEENDVVARLHHASRVEVIQVLAVIRPTERRVRPQSRAKPCVQHILVLSQRARPARVANCRVIKLHYHLIAVVAVPYGYAMSPPQLAADAPVADIVHPVEIDPGKPLRDYPRVAACHGIASRLRQWLHLHIPLVRDNRLDNIVAPVAVPHRMTIRLDVFQQPVLFKLRDYILTSLRHVLTLVRSGV